MKTVWSKAVELAKAEPVTAAHVKQAVAEVGGKSDKNTKTKNPIRSLIWIYLCAGIGWKIRRLRQERSAPEFDTCLAESDSELHQ